jgi:hypothetical protein
MQITHINDSVLYRKTTRLFAPLYNPLNGEIALKSHPLPKLKCTAHATDEQGWQEGAQKNPRGGKEIEIICNINALYDCWWLRLKWKWNLKMHLRWERQERGTFQNLEVFRWHMFLGWEKLLEDEQWSFDRGIAEYTSKPIVFSFHGKVNWRGREREKGKKKGKRKKGKKEKRKKGKKEKKKKEKRKTSNFSNKFINWVWTSALTWGQIFGREIFDNRPLCAQLNRAFTNCAITSTSHCGAV